MKKGNWLPAILIALAVLLAGCKENNAKESAGTNKSENKAPIVEMEKYVPTVYDSTITVNVEEKTLTGTLKVKSTNNTGKTQDKIYFHVYPNQFREDEDLLGGFWRQIIDENSEPGSIEVTEVQVNDKKR